MRTILKINSLDSVECFTSLAKLFLKYPELEKQKSNIEAYLSRKKQDYKTADFIIRRVSVNEI